MSKFLSLSMFGALFALTAAVAPAQAQATRTWVSGVGDDVNPCSRTAPCKTYAGAISKTTTNGEISTLDPGGFGTINITKGITIDGGGGHGSLVGHILAAGTTGVIVNMVNTPTDRVILRNLTIQGVGTGTTGINFVQGGSLEVENVRIMNFTGPCIDFSPTTKADLIVQNTTMNRCVGGGIVSSAVNGGSNFVELSRSTIYKSGVGVTSGANSRVQVWNSVLSHNGLGGLLANSATSEINLDSSSVVYNNNYGIQATGGGTVRLTNTSVTANNGTGLLVNGGSILSWQNNYVAGNNVDGAPSGIIAPQ